MLRSTHPLCKAKYEVYREQKAQLGREPINLRLQIISSRSKEAQRVVDVTTHSGRLNVPLLKDCLAVVYNEEQLEAYAKQYIIVNYRRQGGARTYEIPYHNPDMRPLCYPLLFPYGQLYFKHGTRAASVSKNMDVSTDELGDKADFVILNDGPEVEIVTDNAEQLPSHYTAANEAHPDADVVPEGGTSEWATFPASTQQNTRRNVINFHLFTRRADNRHWLFSTNRLGQMFLIGEFLAVESDRLTFVRLQDRKKRMVQQSTLVDYLQNVQFRQLLANTSTKIGRHIPLPGNFTGSSRYNAHIFHNTCALFNAVEPPRFFITFTGNPNWPEIRDNLRPGQTAYDNAALITRVFHEKAALFMQAIKEGVMGRPLAWAYHVEFQKRGMPHLHLLLATEVKITTSDELDQYICAQLPEVPEKDDPEYDTKMRLYNCVVHFQIHGPCERPSGAEPFPCRVDQQKVEKNKGKCDKWYPKDFHDLSSMQNQGYAEPKRPHNGRQHVFGEGPNRRIATNQHVVPYNPYLLTLIDAHCNVEHVNAPHSAMIYLFKYINKGTDQAIVKFREEQIKRAIAANQPEVVIDECTEYQQMRFMTSCEAAYRLFGYPLWDMSHTVFELKVHEPGKEYVVIDEGEDEAARARQRRRVYTSQLTAYFRLCATDPRLNNLSYIDVPGKFTWDTQTFQWKERRNATQQVTRIRWVNVQLTELYAIRTLLYHRTGVKSFEDLRTVKQELLSTFHEAAVKTGLLNDDNEWDLAMREVVSFQMPSSARRTFVMILLNSSGVDARKMWEKYKAYMLAHDRNRDTSMLEQHALAHIAQLFGTAGRTLTDFGLPGFDSAVVEADCQADVRENAFDNYRLVASKMNEEQRHITERFLKLLDTPKSASGRFLFCQASGGTGKSFTFNAIIDAANARGKNVLAIASTGIAAQLLRGGRTAHTAFKLGVNPTSTSVIGFDGVSEQALKLRQLHGLIFDECVMQSKVILELIERELRDKALPANRNFPFGGIAVLLGGDWKQLLPVVIKGSREEILDQTHRRSMLWHKFETMTLKKNMRAEPGQEQFANWLEEVGTGKMQIRSERHGDEEFIRVPASMWLADEKSIIDWLYPQSTLCSPQQLAAVALLTVRNNKTLELNDMILHRLPGDIVTLTGSNSIVTDCDANPELPVLQPEQVAQKTPNGFPLTNLRLKIGAVVMLLRNLDVTNGLCNGTRLVVKEIGSHILRCGRIATLRTEEETSGDVLIPRIDFLYESDDDLVRYRRRQFPVRLSFAMTINKSQGQTFTKVGIVLFEPVFSHGHLYVAQ